MVLAAFLTIGTDSVLIARLSSCNNSTWLSRKPKYHSFYHEDHEGHEDGTAHFPYLTFMLFMYFMV